MAAGIGAAGTLQSALCHGWVNGQGTAGNIQCQIDLSAVKLLPHRFGSVATGTALALVGVIASAPVSSQTQKSPPRHTLLDAVVFYATPFAGQYDANVQRELQRFMRRAASYRPRPRPATLGSEMKMVYSAREGYEGKLIAAAATAGVERLAQRYVDDLRPCYEWEGFHDCPEREAKFAEQYLAANPNTPFREFLQLLRAHRWICAAEGYDREEMPQDGARARGSAEAPLATALTSRSLLIRTAAQELKARAGCHASGA